MKEGTAKEIDRRGHDRRGRKSGKIVGRRQARCLVRKEQVGGKMKGEWIPVMILVSFAWFRNPRMVVVTVHRAPAYLEIAHLLYCVH